MIKSLTLISFLFAFVNDIYSQTLQEGFGARAKAMGGSYVATADKWSVFNNVGGISGVSGGSVLFGYDLYPNLEGFDRVAAGVVQPLSFGTVGFSVYKFGDELYSEQTASLSFGNKVGFVRLGGRINYYQMRIDEFGTTSAFYVDLGGIVEVSEKVHFGAYISNLSASTLNDASGSDLPVFMRIGLSYLPTKDLVLNLDLHKDVENEAEVLAGIEYLVGERIYLRTGISTNPFKGYFGGGITFNRFAVDYAVAHNEVLGVSHQLGISFNYQK